MAQVLTREMAQARLVGKAMADPAFRATLVADPKKAIAEEFGTAVPPNIARAAIVEAFGVSAPPNIAIEVLEETSTHDDIVLSPKLLPVEGGEMADEDPAGDADGAFCCVGGGGRDVWTKPH